MLVASFVVLAAAFVVAGVWVFRQLLELRAWMIVLRDQVFLHDRQIDSLDGDLDASNHHLMVLTEKLEARRARKG